MADGRSRALHAGAAILALVLAGCATVAADDRAWVAAGGTAEPVPLACPPAAALPQAGAIDPARPLSIVVWNVHRNGDPGWADDLAAFAAASDLVLLQEAASTRELRERLGASRPHWAQADAWAFDGVVSGVLTASAEPPRAACVLRAAEPLLALPKSALLTWYRLAGRADTLAVANVHSVNFTIDTDAYRRQLEAVVGQLAGHRGPAILAGDFNTWSASRAEVLADVAGRAGFAEAVPRRGARSSFLGRPADYLFVRGLAVDDVWVEPVESSDHAPIRAMLRLPAR